MPGGVHEGIGNGWSAILVAAAMGIGLAESCAHRAHHLPVCGAAAGHARAGLDGYADWSIAIGRTARHPQVPHGYAHRPLSPGAGQLPKLGDGAGAVLCRLVAGAGCPRSREHAALAAHDLASTPRWLLFLLAVLVNLLGTWADVPVNALAIQILPESERLRAGALRSAATSVGAIVGGGIMLLIQTRMGWAWPFWLLALGLFAGVLLVALLRSSPSAPATDSTPVRAGWREGRGYFAVPQHRLWAVLLLLYVSFIGAAWVYLKPLLLNHGFAPQQIALIVGVGGGLVAAASSLAASRLTRMLGTRVALPLFSLASVGAVGALAVTIGVQGPPGAYIAAAMAVALAMGAAAGLVFGLMMYHTRSGLAALDYGIQSSLFIIARTLVPLAAGVLLDRYGYGGMLAGLLAGLTLALAASLYSRDRIHIKASTAH